MTQQKSLKRRVRSRMEKTGERYTTARANLLGPDGGPADGQVSAEAIVDATGHSLEEWIEILDEWGALDKSHGEIARHVNEDHGVGGWWSQSVAVLYERAKGLRAVGQRADGSFSAGGSKTVNVEVDRLFDAFEDAGLRKRWLGNLPVELKTATRPKYVRFDLPDGTRLTAGMGPKGEGKSNVGIEHSRLPDAGAREELKAFWRERLAELKRVLEG